MLPRYSFPNSGYGQGTAFDISVPGIDSGLNSTADEIDFSAGFLQRRRS
jgi:hypothetical protein